MHNGPEHNRRHGKAFMIMRQCFVFEDFKDRLEKEAIRSKLLLFKDFIMILFFFHFQFPGA